MGTYPKFSDFVTFVSRIAADSMIPIYGDEAMKVKPSPIKCDVEESCEQCDTCVEYSGVGDKVTDMTKYDVLDSCEHSDTCVDNSTIDDKVTDMTKYDVLDSCEQSDTCVDNSTIGDKVTDVTKSDIQGSCQQSDTCVDNFRVVDKVTDVTKSDVHGSCEQSDTCVSNPSVGDNEPYATRIYFGWALSGPVAGSSRQVHVNCVQTGVKQHNEVSPHIESTIADSLAVSPREGNNLTSQHNPCIQNSEAKGGARVAIECSCSISVYNTCLPGPCPTDTRVHGMLRFWQLNYAAGVECMYMQYKIPEKDINTRRLFWYFVYYESYALR